MTGPDRPTRTIYIAEDNTILLRGLQRALTAHGYEVRTAADAAGMLALLRAPDPDPDLLLLDLMMPGMSGLELLRTLREQERWSELPVILITAATAEEISETDVDAGDVDVLLKPFRLDELLGRVAARLDGASGRSAADSGPGGSDHLE